ncbi:MAG: penicillin-binding protein 2 [Chloroflexi bacterium]|nr:MAG: penicillin-binding protein 2 [Chloroflexota bacterium]
MRAGAVEGNGLSARRFGAVAFAIVASLVVLSARLYDLQVLQSDHYRGLADQNRMLRLPLTAERGLIYDRNGVALARNIPGFLISVLPADLPAASQPDVVQKLATLLSVPAEDIATLIRAGRARSPYEPVAVTRRPVGRDVALLVEERLADLPGVRVDTTTIRQYSSGSLYAPVLGYVGPLSEDEYVELRSSGYLPDDLIGRTGVESVYEKYLRGTYGVREVERDAAQREIKTLAEQPALPGGNVVLTIDDKLQQLIASELRQSIQRNEMLAGVGIAMNPQNGEILALVSIPSYDDNVFVRGVTDAEMAGLNADKARPLVNKAIGDIYPPGSTFKAVTGLAALNEGTANPHTIVNVSSNVLTVNGYNFFDWRAHGAIDFITGYAHSSDIYFYTLGGGNPYTGQKGVGPDKIAEYARMLGFGAPTGIDLPGEASGIIPDPQWKVRELGEEWTIGNTYHMAIGQGFDAVTPLQLLQGYATIANGGTVYTPHVLKQVNGAGGATIYQKPVDVVRKVAIAPENLRLIRQGMRLVVSSGHAWMPNAKLPIAGKTGTAEFGVATPGKPLQYHNWFVSYLPKYDSPDAPSDIAMVIFAYGSSTYCVAAYCPNPAVSITQHVYESYAGGQQK